MSLKGIADGIAANAIWKYGLFTLPAILPFAAQMLYNMRNAIATHLKASIMIATTIISILLYCLTLTLFQLWAAKKKFNKEIKEIKKDFRLYLKPVGDTGFSIDTRDGKPVCPQCAGNGIKSQIRCQIRLDAKNLSEYTEIECSYKPTEHRCRLEGNPFELETSRAFWRDCHSSEARKTHDLLFGLSEEKQRKDND